MGGQNTRSALGCNSTTYTNSQVVGNTVNIQSGGDTNLKGAVVKGEH
ncbi:hemagglutinin repeat-containing protein [Limnohabitans sp. DM1]